MQSAGDAEQQLGGALAAVAHHALGRLSAGNARERGLEPHVVGVFGLEAPVHLKRRLAPSVALEERAERGHGAIGAARLRRQRRAVGLLGLGRVAREVFDQGDVKVAKGGQVVAVVENLKRLPRGVEVLAPDVRPGAQHGHQNVVVAIERQRIEKSLGGVEVVSPDRLDGESERGDRRLRVELDDSARKGHGLEHASLGVLREVGLA